jgi:hypothetical protein
MNNIDYVVISSDDNPMYKDFYPIVAKRWFDLGFKTYYVNITDEDSIEESEWGIVHKMKSLDFVSTGFQSQVVRLFTSTFIEARLLMSDIDMLPLNGNYFSSISKDLNDKNVIIFSGQPYGDVPYYPMCYVLSKSENFKKYLNIENLSFEHYCKKLYSKYGNAWNTDENFMYDQFENFKEQLLIRRDRDFSRRIDRGNWFYNESALKNGYYIDSHLLRPYNTHKKYIDKLVELC